MVNIVFICGKTWLMLFLFAEQMHSPNWVNYPGNNQPSYNRIHSSDRTVRILRHFCLQAILYLLVYSMLQIL